MTTKRTVVKRPNWMEPSDLDGRIEVGPREERGFGQGRKPLYARDVFLDGKKVGSIMQIERRGERHSRNSRLVTVTGYPVEWRIMSGPGSFTRYGWKTIGETCYRMLRDLPNAQF